MLYRGPERHVRWIRITGVWLVSMACGDGSEAADAAGSSPSTMPIAALAVPTEEKYAGSEILVSHTGAAGAPAGLTRTEAEAHAKIEDLWRQLEAGASFEALARGSSDGTEAARGGALGTWRTGTMVPEFESAVAAISVGQITRPFHTAFGWHVARRDAVIEIVARHVVVTWAGAWRSGATRTRDQARARIEAAAAELAGGADFAAVAAKYSDDATAGAGGDLGVIAPGQLVPAFEDAAFALQPGQRSAVVETPYGFHLIERVR